MSFEQLLQDGERLFNVGQWDEAETVLKDAVSACVTDFRDLDSRLLNLVSTLYYYLGSISEGMGREDEADECETVRLEIVRALERR